MPVLSFCSPPLGKLVFYYISYFAGYNHAHCGYANIQDQYGPQCKYIVLRAIAAFFGSITSPFLYGIVRGFGGSIRAGIIAALLFTFDGLNTSESRLILIDSQLIFWCTFSLWVAQRWWRRWNSHYAALEEFEEKTGYTPSLGFGSFGAAAPATTANANSKRSNNAKNADKKEKLSDDLPAMTLTKEEEQEASAFGLIKLTGVGSTSPLVEAPASTTAAKTTENGNSKQAGSKGPSKAFISLLNQAELLEQEPRVMHLQTRLMWWFAVALACANAVSIKFTALATPGLIAVESFFAFFFLKRSVPIMDLLAIAVIVIVVFIFYYYLHFGLLPNTGDGDAFMAVDFQRTLVNNTHYDPNARKPGLLRMVWELNHEMVVASARIEQRHHWDSVWWEWIFNLRGILYYSRDAGKDTGTPSHSYTETIYLLGNPMVIWAVLGGMGVLLVLLGLYARYRSDPLYALPKRFDLFVSSTIFCLIAYWLNLLPYLAVKRSSFIYHYSECMGSTQRASACFLLLGFYLTLSPFASGCSACPRVRRDYFGAGGGAASREALDAPRNARCHRCGRGGLPYLCPLDLRLPSHVGRARKKEVAVEVGLKRRKRS
jgi:C-terminal four TMM region of protein-O-mannosyltransferase/Dolichyl-phosphate-mannose-protein mannosyltransferase